MKARIALAAVVVGLLAAAGVLAQGEVYLPGSGITPPVVIRQTEATYTQDAQQAGIRGTVEIQGIILPNGTVGELRVTKSLDQTHGLDAEAVKAAKQWLFKPGMRNGVPVPVRVTLVIEFRPISAPVLAPPVVFRSGTSLTYPVIVNQPEPQYTPAARQAGIQGDVEIEAVIKADGTVGLAHVTRSLDTVNGLDDAALATAKRWTFKPATRDGVPVDYTATLVLTYRLGASQSRDDFAQGAYPEDTPDLVAPKAIRTPEPKYTSDAMRAKIQGEALVEVVVDTNGNVLRARIKQSVDKVYGLDNEAVAAAKQWTFEPATLKGAKVSVVTTIRLTFRLH